MCHEYNVCVEYIRLTIKLDTSDISLAKSSAAVCLSSIDFVLSLLYDHTTLCPFRRNPFVTEGSKREGRNYSLDIYQKSRNVYRQAGGSKL